MGTGADLDLSLSPGAYVALREAHLGLKLNRDPAKGIADSVLGPEATWANGVDDFERNAQAAISALLSAVNPPLNLVGDGETDSTEALQDAIDALADAGGGAIVLPRGVFVYTSLTLRSGVDLIGSGGTVLKAFDHVSDTLDNQAHYFIRANDQDDITIRGIIFDGTQDTNRPAVEGPSWVADILTITGDRIRILDCTFLDAADSAIMFAQCTNSEVRGCYFDNCPDLGIYYNDTNGEVASNNLITNNRFTRCQYGAIGIKRNAAGLAVVGNTIRDCGNGITLEDFGSGDHPLRILIASNRLERIGHSYTGNVLVAAVGISCNAAHGTLINDNLLDDIVGPCIALDGADHCVVQGNSIYGTASGGSNNRGITLNVRNSQGCRHNLITGNVVRGVRSTGLAVLSGTGDHQYNRIANNDIASDAGSGMRVASTNFLDNDIEGNRFARSGVGFFDLDINISSGTVVRNRWARNRLQDASQNGFVDVQTASIAEDYGPMDLAIGLAAPTVGAWKRGSIVFNYQPAGDGTWAWVCTAAGTPGTWLALKGVPGSGVLTLLGDLRLLTAGQRVELGDGSTAGNVGLRSNKADGNNITWGEWAIGALGAQVAQWIGQIDTSENWNILDNAAAVALQIQRTGGYVRAANGFRVGAAAGPLITSGAGAPAAALPDGSIYLRTDGTAATTLYVRAAGAWSALT